MRKAPSVKLATGVNAAVEAECLCGAGSAPGERSNLTSVVYFD